MISFRNAAPADAPELARLGARTFFETANESWVTSVTSVPVVSPPSSSLPPPQPAATRATAAIAAASIVAKVVRDRAMRRMDALYPQYGFRSHVGYITPGHSAVVRQRGPSDIHRRSFEALCYSPEAYDAVHAEAGVGV